jgi:hypothetical protein
MTKLMSNHDWVTMSVILVRILITKPLIFIKVRAVGRQVGGWAGQWAGGHKQGRAAQLHSAQLHQIC